MTDKISSGKDRPIQRRTPRRDGWTNAKRRAFLNTLAATANVAQATRGVGLKPHAACLVPEKREERTTEGGLDVVGQEQALRPAIARLKAAGCRVSLFIEADEAPIAMAAKLGAPVIELHTGTWCHAVADGHTDKAQAEFARLAKGAAYAASLGLEVHAGHGLDYDTARQLAAVPEFVEFNIGHFLMGEAIFVGLDAALLRMRQAMDEGRGAV